MIKAQFAREILHTHVLNKSNIRTHSYGCSLDLLEACVEPTKNKAPSNTHQSTKTGKALKFFLLGQFFDRAHIRS